MGGGPGPPGPPPPGPPAADAGPVDASGFMAAVSKLNDTDIPQLKYEEGTSRPAVFERWSQLLQLKVSSLRPAAAVYWQAVRMAAETAYDQ